MTPVTAESFAVWKAQRNERDALLEEENKKKKQDEFKKMKAGLKTGVLFSGKDLFDFNPEWAKDQDDMDAVDEYERQGSDDEGAKAGSNDDNNADELEKLTLNDKSK